MGNRVANDESAGGMGGHETQGRLERRSLTAKSMTPFALNAVSARVYRPGGNFCRKASNSASAIGTICSLPG